MVIGSDRDDGNGGNFGDAVINMMMLILLMVVVW